MTAPAPTSPVVARRRLAAELRRARAQAGLSLEQAAAVLECSVAKLSRIETAMVRVRVQDVRELAGHYQRPDVDALLGLARTARGRAWWDQYADMLPDAFTTFIGLEDEASDIWTYEPTVLPGLLQTAGYARAVMTLSGIHGPDLVERGMDLRMQRQRILDRPGGPALWALVDESALRRPVPDRAVWAGQLEHLLALPRQVTFQVVPLAAGHGLAGEGVGAFTVVGFADPGVPRAAYTEILHDAFLTEAPADLGEYLALFDRLRQAALDVDEMADLIRSMLTAHTVGSPGG